MNSVEPALAKVGDAVTANGVNLGPEYVAALYMTDGKADVKVAILEQTDASIRFRIPPETKPGRYALMVLTRGKDSKLIEEPVRISVEAETSESTASPNPLARSPSRQ
ncbi:MAG TPA: hypothetical protein VGH38_10055 [Bryobacteraceae bacterium]